MKPSLFPLRAPFVLGSLAMHMFAATVTVPVPSPRTSKPAEPFVYFRPGGALDTQPPGKPDFYLVWPRDIPPISSDCGFEDPPGVIICPEAPSRPALGIPLPDEVEERLLRLRLENAAMRARTTPNMSFYGTYRVPRRRLPAVRQR